jgi:hypothetical protein
MKTLQAGKKCEKESKTHRGVSFSKTIETYNVLALDDYTDKEIAGTWFNKDELHIIAHKDKIKRRAKRRRSTSSKSYSCASPFLCMQLAILSI